MKFILSVFLILMLILNVTFSSSSASSESSEDAANRADTADAADTADTADTSDASDAADVGDTAEDVGLGDEAADALSDAVDAGALAEDLSSETLQEIQDFASLLEDAVGDSFCSESERNIILATYVWESSQVLTRDIQSYLVFSCADEEGADSFLTRFNNVVAMRNGEMEYSSEFPLLEGRTATFDSIYQAIFNEEEFALYQQAIDASNALVSLEEMAIMAIQNDMCDVARDLLISTQYLTAKQNIEAASKGAFNALAERIGCTADSTSLEL